MSDFAERVTRKNSNNETDLPLTISSKDGLVDQISYFNKTVASKDMSGYYLLRNGEYAYNKSYSVGYDFGSIKRLDRYPMGALSTLYICFALKKHDTDFIKVYFDSLKWYKEIYMISAEGARNHGLLNVPTDEFFATKHYLPENTAEQRKIADFLIALDRRIDAQQSLVDALKKYKRGLISEILNQKIRITHEDEKWEEVSLSAVADGFEYGMNAAATIFDGVHKYIRITDIDDDSHTYIDSAPVSPAGVLEGKYRVRENDILFARTGASVGKSYLYQASDGDMYFAGFLIRIHVIDGVDSGYVFLNTLTEEYNRWVALESTRSGQPGINAEQYRRYRFKLPPLETQKQISAIAQKIDAQIKRESQCLRLLQKQKDGLLQQLFI
ncbi:restriction endonuclease subunit S [Pseudoflavonifractor sp. MCC625]|uniref:restriction endonuclease subunit S n=1 Tax=Pseudoflavonifractor sp. MCC625 TaxID=2592647 RepID=UPI001C0209BD|nr:restriction endonuclease subunit S [Pseudoflavonifractor sp. MCC625]MBT9685534.1 restriction endonuclease subunit S [Pseudoflavonifractor sp. MCC625]